MAAIRAEIRAANVKDPSKIKIEDLILEFIKKPLDGRPLQEKKPDPAKMAQMIAQSKQNWLSATGWYKYNKKNPKKKK